MTAAWHCPYTPYEPSVQIETDDSERILIWTRFTHVCPAESRGAPHPGGSLPNLHSAGLYGSEKDGNTKTYLEVNRRRKTEGRKQREIKIKKSYDIRQRLAQDIIWDFMSHQRERKLAWQKRICYKKKIGEKKKGIQPWGNSTDGPWCSAWGRDLDGQQSRQLAFITVTAIPHTHSSRDHMRFFRLLISLPRMKQRWNRERDVMKPSSKIYQVLTRGKEVPSLPAGNMTEVFYEKVFWWYNLNNKSSFYKATILHHCA